MSSYWRNVAAVLTGTGLAQLIPILGALVIARQFMPAEFGIYSVWLGVVLFLAVVMTGRFEAALAIEPDGEQRKLAVAATLVTTLLAASASALLVAVAAYLAPGLMPNFPAVLIGLAVPTGLAIAAAQTWQSWAAAEGSYRILSIMRIAQAAAITLAQIAAGAVFAEASALALAHLLGVLAGLALSARLLPLRRVPGRHISHELRAFWRRQYRFPLFALPADGINTAAAQLPVLIVAARFGAEVAGLLALTMRTLGAPIGLLGKAVLDVFKRHASVAFRETGACRAEYLRTFKVLGLASVIFVAVMAFLSEPLFALAFGERWLEAGTIAVWLLPLFALRFIASPLSYTAYIAGKQHVDLFWQVALLSMTVMSLSIPQRYDIALQAYSLGYSVLYLIYLAMSYRFSLGDKRWSPS